jgi:hypothetical protein
MQADAKEKKPHACLNKPAQRMNGLVRQKHPDFAWQVCKASSLQQNNMKKNFRADFLRLKISVAD